jgi:hypothetical protein
MELEYITCSIWNVKGSSFQEICISPLFEILSFMQHVQYSVVCPYLLVHVGVVYDTVGDRFGVWAGML